MNKEEPFDVFICYKENDEDGKRTVDSSIANDIYYQLTQEGFKVFYAPITLEEKLGYEYEPYIFSAINSAKVMLVLGTKNEYFDSVWVRNEWSRFLKLTKTDRSKLLIPCYRDMDVYELPDAFAHLQAQDMSKIGFISDVIRGLKKVCNHEEQIKQTLSQKNKPKYKKESKFKAKLKERAKYCLKFPIHKVCFSFFIITVLWTVYFFCKEVFSWYAGGWSLIPLFSSVVRFFTFAKLIKCKATAVVLQGAATIVSVFAAVFVYVAYYQFTISPEHIVLVLITTIIELLWFVLFCFSKKTEKTKIKKVNKVIAFVVSIAVTLLIVSVLETGALKLCGYHIAKTYYTSGSYLEACDCFTALGDYKDSEYLAKDSQYLRLKKEIEQGDIDDYTISALGYLGDFKDAEVLKNSLLFEKAEKLHQEKNYVEAAIILATLDDPKAKELFETVKKDAHSYAIERMNTKGYTECTVEELYSNPKKYNGKKICITGFSVCNWVFESGSGVVNKTTSYHFFVCDDLSLAYRAKDNSLGLLNYYLEYTKPLKKPCVYGYSYKDYRQKVINDIPKGVSIVTICGKFTYNPNVENTEVYEKYRIDVHDVLTRS